MPIDPHTFLKKNKLQDDYEIMYVLKKIKGNSLITLFDEKYFTTEQNLGHYEMRWRETFAKRCAYCKSQDNLTLDHIIPISFLKFLIPNASLFWCADNVQFLCHACNIKKGNHIDHTHPKTKRLLRKFINHL